MSREQRRSNVNVNGAGLLGGPAQGLISHAEVLEKETIHHRGSPSEAGGAGCDSLSSSPPVGGQHGGTPQGGNSPRARLLSRGSRSFQLHQWEEGHSTDAREEALLLYEHGQSSDMFTLLLQGRALIRTGTRACWTPRAAPALHLTATCCLEASALRQPCCCGVYAMPLLDSRV